MPVDKQVFIRYQALNRCFRNPYRDFTIDELVDECNKALRKADKPDVSKRTIQNDINILEADHGIRLDEKLKRGRQRLYRYVDTNYSLPLFRMNLTASLGKGWSVDTLENARNFYNIYAKSEPLVRKSDVPIEKSEPVVRNLETTGNRNHWLLNHQFVLPWSHYQILTHVKDSEARSFYEIEASKQQWSKRQLQRQIGSGLYERLALSRDKDEVMRLATKGQVVEKPSDIIKDPLVLEFLA